MKRILLAGATLLALTAAQPTLAADAPVYKGPAPVAAVFDWTGLYIGIVGGGGDLVTRHTNDTNGGHSGDSRISGGLLGATLGYNVQYGSWVLGLEGDISWSGIRAHFNDTNGSGFCSPAGIDCVTDLLWLGTGRARVGFAWDRVLLFATAGVAFGTVRGTLTFAGFTVGENTRVGFTYGGGIEWAFARNWSVKGEYLRIDSLEDKVTYTPGPERVSLKDINIFRAGLNYRF